MNNFLYTLSPKQNEYFLQELSTNTSSRQALLESEEKIRDLQKENSILRESNNKLLDSAYSVEVERQFHASENALKVPTTNYKWQ
jgi:hypothetical protein